MEEFTPDGGKDEKTPRRWRRFLPGNFLGSHLRDKEGSESKQKPEEDDEEELDAGKSKRFRLLDKLRQHSRRMFRNIIGLDIVALTPAPETAEAAVFRGPESQTSPKDADADEVVKDLDVAHQSTEDELKGLLPVSDEAIRRRNEELHSISQAEANQVHPDTVLAYEALAEPPERRIRRELNDRDLERATPVYTERNNDTDKGAVKVEKVLQERLKRRLRRDKRNIKQLKQQAKSTKEEQAEIKQQEEEFKHKLTDQEKLNDRVLNRQEALTNISERNRRELNVLVQTTPALPEKPSPIQISPEINLSEKTTNPELPEQAIKELVSHPDSSKPEVIEQAVEKAADQNIAIENLYERRHEKKDEPAVVGSASVITPSPTPASPSFTTERRQIYNQVQKVVTRSLPQTAKQSIQSLMNEDVYRQAAKTGFWTAIGICILAFLAFMALG